MFIVGRNNALTKHEACKMRHLSPTADLAVKNWNLLNETIRIKVMSTKVRF